MPGLPFAEHRGDEQEMPPQGAPCGACGAPADLDDHFCPACGSPLGTDPSQQPVAAAAPRFFRCQNCGGQMATDPDQRSYTCAFCDSTYVVEFSPDQTDRQRPEFVIGFAFTRQQAEERFRHWIANTRWFQPADLTSAQIVARLQGVYMPFWSFTMLAQSNWSALIGEHWYRTERYTVTINGKRVRRTRRVQETEWWDLAGRHHQYHSGYLISGSGGLPQEEAERIKPFRLEALKRYEPYFLAGWLAEEYAVPRHVALQRAQEAFGQQEKQDVARFLPGDRHQKLQVQTEFSHVHSDLILLPVYVLTYRYGDQLYRFLMNGQTGKLAGDKPVSPQKIAAAVAAGIGLVLLLVLVFLLWRWTL
ncbi:MAG: zinc ribbon domain-containing protein [Planctomycetales bacterium]|nr:zinc ribbon domain-containing protein [Planctomycetales bacterium]NIM09524.1 zinc ribbon domain-containing protein [Planctomycetales bacterium]NIN09012.1 zinc ribbon domain-containing protein [Planctomycetales bacterium]NIN78127.1 zinc ribbon domain-containing protein [Planctomycetales bacterium]NIO35307.1 zinc ribbon domain-containing protein [Planctomycetales bacterium]